HAHEGRLAGSIATHEADDLARIEADRHLADSVHAAEGDVDVSHFDKRGALRDSHGSSSSFGQEPRRRLMVSRPTARISTMPATTFCPGELTPMKLNPYASDCMTNAPSTAPGMVPMPPANEVPPTTAAAMTYS